MAKPDNRADNVEKLQRSVQNTQQNLTEAEQYLEEHAEEITPDEASSIRGKNERRRDSMADDRREIKDEARAKR